MAFFEKSLNLAMGLIRFEASSICQTMIIARKLILPKDSATDVMNTHIEYSLTNLFTRWVSDGRIRKFDFVFKFEPDLESSRAERKVFLELILNVTDMHNQFTIPDRAHVRIEISDAEGVQFKVLGM